MEERGAIWHRVICRKYEEGSWWTFEVGGTYWVGVWKVIRLGWDLVGNGMMFEMGNGRRVHFWLDRWCRDVPLRKVFPSLCAIAVNKEAWVGRPRVVRWRG